MIPAAPMAYGVMLFGIQHGADILQRAVAGKQFHTALFLRLREFPENPVLLAVGTAVCRLHLYCQRAAERIAGILLFRWYLSASQFLLPQS